MKQYHLWGQFTRNFPPIILALFTGYVAIELLGDRTIETLETISITPQPVKPGDKASILYKGRQSANCEGIVHRWIIDSKGTLIQLDDANVFRRDETAAGVFTFTKTFNVPLGLAPGTATYNANVLRWCNSWQQFLWPVRYHYTAKFEVAAP